MILVILCHGMTTWNTASSVSGDFRANVAYHELNNTIFTGALTSIVAYDCTPGFGAFYILNNASFTGSLTSIVAYVCTPCFGAFYEPNNASFTGSSMSIIAYDCTPGFNGLSWTLQCFIYRIVNINRSLRLHFRFWRPFMNFTIVHLQKTQI